jgi:hypothetical protein
MISSFKKSGHARFLLPSLIFLLFISGCGYQVRTEGAPLGIEIKSLAIPTVTSKSTLLGFEGLFTKIIRDEFVSHASVPLVPREQAEFVLIGRISDIKTDPVSYRVQSTEVQGQSVSYAVTRSRRLRVELTAKMMERSTGKVVWEEERMVEKAFFQVGEDPLVNRYYEKRAVEQTASRLAERIFLKTAQRF